MLVLMEIFKWVAIVSFSYFILRNLKHWILWIIGDMVLRGWWFPKTMKKELDIKILETHRINRHIDLIATKIENAKTQEEVDEYYSQLINLKNK